MIDDGGDGFAGHGEFELTIVGDGTGARATAYNEAPLDGSITNTSVDAAGSGYTHATATLSGGSLPATFTVVLGTPVGGGGG